VRSWKRSNGPCAVIRKGNGRLSLSWCVSSVRHILFNRRYAGKIVWNTRRKLRVPGTGKRVFRPRPESEWVTVDAPHLRIITPKELGRFSPNASGNYVSVHAGPPAFTHACK
jgi:hypothetical protein